MNGTTSSVMDRTACALIQAFPTIQEGQAFHKVGWTFTGNTQREKFDFMVKVLTQKNVTFPLFVFVFRIPAHVTLFH